MRRSPSSPRLMVLAARLGCGMRPPEEFARDASWCRPSSRPLPLPRLPTHASGKGVGRCVGQSVACAWCRPESGRRLAGRSARTRVTFQRTEVTMSTPVTVVRCDRASHPSFGNGLGLLLHEQRCLRRAHPRQRPERALSPVAALRRRLHAAVSAAACTPRQSSGESEPAPDHACRGGWTKRDGEQTMTPLDVAIRTGSAETA